ncbi:MAG: 1-deoxy-D-xylulose-5-phosphate reductoisomerase [Clostridiales bacterium]|nr:1-deoxy-D-xylulose-5-phosphate reductoisomerase [Clostridiales bacterium]
MKKVAILGSTGSIGLQALSVISSNPRRVKAAVLTCKSRVDVLRSQIKRFRPEAVVVERRQDALELRREYRDLKVYYGPEGLEEAAGAVDYDVLLNALVGIAGLRPTLAAIKRGGVTIALANKETLVTGGRIVMGAASEADVPIVPVDSEHSAIFQCLVGNLDNPIRRILLTASGGPFRGYDRARLEAVTLSDALIHPVWRMGRKITIDSATLINKGFEVIEAKWLFDVDASSIEVAIHPQGIVHSLVEFEDGALLAQLGDSDMRVPISYAFSWPDRWAIDSRSVDIIAMRSLYFEEPVGEARRSLDMAYRVVREIEESEGDSSAVVLNSADEELVELFLAGKIPFVAILDTMSEVLDKHIPRKIESIEDIMDIDLEARAAVRERWR